MFIIQNALEKKKSLKETFEHQKIKIHQN